MKRMKILPLVLLFGVVLFSCEKDSTKEWQYKYGFTLQDVIGHFTFSGASNAFEGLTESEYFHLCDDAIIDISSSGVNGSLTSGVPRLISRGLILDSILLATTIFSFR